MGGIEVMTFGLFPMNADVCRFAPPLRWELTNYRKPSTGLRYRLSRECRTTFGALLLAFSRQPSIFVE